MEKIIGLALLAVGLGLWGFIVRATRDMNPEEHQPRFGMRRVHPSDPNDEGYWK